MKVKYDRSNSLKEIREEIKDKPIEYVLQRISDLEAKLAEKNKTIDEINKEFLSAIKDWKQLVEIEKTEKEQLKQQLAEWQDGTIICKWTDAENKIKELEQQLAEKETRIAELEDKDWYEGTIKQLEEQNERLLNKLAEKDKKQERTNKVVKQFQQRVKYFSEQDQDKISFCIEQLEKVKEEVDKRPVSVRNCGYGDFDEIILDDVYDVIDNQIASLKKGVG